ncbi:MAG: hypothetical protein K2W95_26605 [Candidatus Obscuribacterales bacterium]|nr:hypothetical protein [Candidatus Obscuribacterales bacterium]
MMTKVVNKFVNTGRITQSRIVVERMPETGPQAIVTPANRSVRNPMLVPPKQPPVAMPKKPSCLNDIFSDMIESEPQFATVAES